MGRRPAALLRLHSACTSVAHFLAGLQGGDAVILGLAYDEEGSVHLPLLEASQIVATLSCHVYDALLACQPDEEGAGGPWAGCVLGAYC